jgi:hypothetical protein
LRAPTAVGVPDEASSAPSERFWRYAFDPKLHAIDRDVNEHRVPPIDLRRKELIEFRFQRRSRSSAPSQITAIPDSAANWSRGAPSKTRVTRSSRRISENFLDRRLVTKEIDQSVFCGCGKCGPSGGRLRRRFRPGL